jgi:hypothetical protein
MYCGADLAAEMVSSVLSGIVVRGSTGDVGMDSSDWVLVELARSRARGGIIWLS